MKAPDFFYKNAGLGSLMATITSAAAIFLIFRMAYRHLGAPVVGTWALIQSIMVISGLAAAGSAENITRLVAIDRAQQGTVSVRSFLATGLLVNTAPMLLLGAVIVLPTYYYVAHNYGHLVPIPILTGLVVCSLTFGVFSSIGAILSGCLDGLGLMALRGYLACIANVVFAALGYLCIYWAGGVGLGLSYVTYTTTQITAFALAIILFRPRVGAGYKRQSVRELAWKTVNFNAKFLFLNLCKLLMDPTCKLLIGHFGSLDSVAIFDLANKVTTQSRILYQAALQFILPLVSRATSGMAEELRTKLVRWNQRVARWSLYTVSLVVLSSSYISEFSLGRIDQRFVLIVSILAIGNLINTIGLIGYYVDVGSGHLERLVKVFGTTAIINVALGYSLGHYLGVSGVACSFALALAFAGLETARPVLGNPYTLAKTLLSRATPEVLLFVVAVFVAWIVLVGKVASSPVPKASLVLVTVIGAATLFVFRELPIFIRLTAYLPRALQPIWGRLGGDDLKHPPV